MKKLFLSIVAIMVLAACHQNKGSQASQPTTIKFADPVYNFGKINQGDSVTHNYKFTNTGSQPYIVTDATATCGCTKPVVPPQPTLPGADGVIKVTFHSAGKSGLQDKMIIITGNTTPTQTVVHLVGEVLLNKK